MSKNAVLGPLICRLAGGERRDMHFQVALTSEHVAYLVEFRSTSSEIRGRKERKKKKNLSLIHI